MPKTKRQGLTKKMNAILTKSYSESRIVLDEDVMFYSSYHQMLVSINDSSCNSSLRMYISDYADKILSIRVPNEVLRYKAKLTVHKALDVIFESRSNMLHNLLRYDGSLFGHSVNVAVMSALVLEDEMFNMCREMKTRIVKGAFLHDIGKCSININVLNKAGKLTDAEYEHVKTHVSAGTVALMEHGERDAIVYAAVAGHHKKINKYYCDKNCNIINSESEDDIELTIDIVAVCDVYDALKSRRHYKVPMDKKSIFEIMSNLTDGNERMFRIKNILIENTH